MALLDIFKKKQEPQKKLKKEAIKKAPKLETKEKKEKVRSEKTEIVKKPVEKKQFSEAYRILRSPHVTEKSVRLSEGGAYVFKVEDSANKPEVKRAIQDLYGVGVERVTIVNIPRKTRRIGRSQGYKAGYKKAIVKLRAGEKIEIMPR